VLFRFVIGWIGRLLGLLAGLILLTWPLFWPPAELRGVWRTQGYGLVVDVGRIMVTAYQRTEVSCLPVYRGPAHSLVLGELGDIALNPDGDGGLRIDIDGASNPIRTRRLDALPAACDEGGTPQEPTVRDAFDIAWHGLNEHYPFFDRHGIDWRARYEALAPGVRTLDGLWPAMQDLLAGIDDTLVYLFDPEGGRAITPAETPPWHAEAVDFREVARANDLTRVEDTGLEYTVLDDNIGYVFLRHTATRPGVGTAQDVKAASAFSRVADALRDTRAIIFDNRLNPGGSDAVALAYAGFFTDSPVPAFTKEIRTRTGYTTPETARTIATDLPLTQPVYLLNSGYTAGAAEVLALALGEMPQVTVLGARTAGALSDIMEITLPTDWRLGMAHQVYRDAAGTVVNGVGVAPDTALPFDAPAFRAGRDPGLTRVLEMIGNE
jgi:hypothetical protein